LIIHAAIVMPEACFARWARNADHVTIENTFEPIQRQPVGVFRHGDEGRQTRRAIGLWQRLRGHLRRHDGRTVMTGALTAATGVCETHVLQHLCACRNEIDLLARHLADARQLTPARARFLMLGNIVFDAHARQRRVDRLAFATLTFVFGNDCFARLSLVVRLRAERFGFVEEQIDLAEAAELLG
jgi:hypothetical protein